jgi:hypothetical protein
MKRFKNISLVYECDEPTLERAATLAKDNRAFIIGNTAERILDTIDCSVLVVKPEGFVSPVAPLIAAEGEK